MQLEEKLAGKEIPAEIIAKVLDRLEEVGLIDDHAFAATWTQSRQANKGMTRSSIRYELKRKGISEENIEDALELVDDDQEKMKAEELVASKMNSVRRLDNNAATRRLVGMLARKGYSPGLAYAVVKEALADREIPDLDIID